MLILYKNDASSKLNAAITAVQTTLTLIAGGGAKFPQPVASQSAFYVTVEGGGNKERMLCTARSVDTLTVTRGQGGTTAAAFANGALTELRANAEMLDKKIESVTRDLDYTISVATTGNDTTGTGTSTAPYATVAKALSTLDNKTSVAGFCSILIGDGEYNTAVALDLVTPFAARLRLKPATPAGSTAVASLDIAGTVRVNSTAYLIGQFIIPATSTGFWYECTTAGTSAATPPTFGTTLGGTTADGAALVWTCRNYHDVSMSLTGTVTLQQNRFVRCDYASLRGVHLAVTVTGSTCKFRVYDRGARVVETTGALTSVVLFPRNVVLFTTAGNSLIESYYGGSLADVQSGIVLDGRNPLNGSTGLALYYWHHVPIFGAAIVNCATGMYLSAGVRVEGGMISGCDIGVQAEQSASAFIDRVTGCVTAGNVSKSAYIGANYIYGCAAGLVNTKIGNTDVFEFRNIFGTAQSLANGSKAIVGTIANANLGVSIIGGSYAEVTTFTANTTNSDLAVNTVGNANSYVKN